MSQLMRTLTPAALAALFIIPAAAQPSVPAAAVPAAAVWQVDSTHTLAHFSVKHLMVSTVRGTLGKVTGTITYDGISPDSVTADIAVEVKGIDTGSAARDRDLQAEDFFDVARYPQITFTSTRVEPIGAGKFRLRGNLSMRGVTREVALDVEGPSPILKQPDGTQRVGASATTTINRRDYGLEYNQMVEAVPVVADDVHIQIDIEATRR